MNTFEFRLREFNTGGFPRGLSVMLSMMSEWIYDKNPVDGITFEAPLQSLKVHMYTCTHIYIYTYIHICIYTHIYIYTYAHIHICTYIHIHIYTYTHIHIYTYIHVQLNIHSYNHNHSHTHTLTHTHTHTLKGRPGRRQARVSGSDQNLPRRQRAPRGGGGKARPGSREGDNCRGGGTARCCKERPLPRGML
jgi:hypothetical protein